MSQKTVLRTKDAVLYDAETLIASENSEEFSVQNFLTGLFYLKTANAGGTSPTLDVKLQTKMPDGTWVDVPGITFTQLTTNGAEMINTWTVDTTNNLAYPQPIGKICRFVLAITGTTPTFDVTLAYILKSS